MNYAVQYNRLLDFGCSTTEAEAKLEEVKANERRALANLAGEKDPRWYADWCERDGTWTELFRRFA